MFLLEFYSLLSTLSIPEGTETSLPPPPRDDGVERVGELIRSRVNPLLDIGPCLPLLRVWAEGRGKGKKAANGNLVISFFFYHFFSRHRSDDVEVTRAARGLLRLRYGGV